MQRKVWEYIVLLCHCMYVCENARKHVLKKPTKKTYGVYEMLKRCVSCSVVLQGGRGGRAGVAALLCGFIVVLKLAVWELVTVSLLASGPSAERERGGGGREMVIAGITL